MTELSETYIFVRSEVRGKRKLDSSAVNPLLQQYRKKLEELEIEEKKSDGGLFKAYTQDVDEFNSELLDDGKTLLFSHKLKISIYDSLPHGGDNYQHRIQSRLAEGLRGIRIDNGKTYSQKIIIGTTGVKFVGGERTTGRWPVERIAGIGY